MRRVAAILVLVGFALPLGAQAPVDSPSDGASIAIEPDETSPEAGHGNSSFDPVATFVHANAAYDDGDFERAVERYRLLEEHGFSSAEVRYNLGNALLRNGELGHAIAAYRRAQALAPRDEDLEANLGFARRATKDALTPPHPSAVASTLFFWHFDLSRAELAGAAAILNLLMWAVLAVRLFRRDSELLRWTFIVLLILTIAVAGSLATRHLFPTRVAVVIPAEVDAFTGPDLETVVRFKLHAGTEVGVRDERDGWLRIALPDGQQGWVSREHLEVVSF